VWRLGKSDAEEFGAIFEEGEHKVNMNGCYNVMLNWVKPVYTTSFVLSINGFCLKKEVLPPTNRNEWKINC
jgi:hypothetical protein